SSPSFTTTIAPGSTLLSYDSTAASRSPPRASLRFLSSRKSSSRRVSAANPASSFFQPAARRRLLLESETAWSRDRQSSRAPDRNHGHGHRVVVRPGIQRKTHGVR